MRLSDAQLEQFKTEGYLVLPDVLSADLLDRIRREYAHLLEGLYQGWHSKGLVPPSNGNFFDMLLRSYLAGASGSSLWISRCPAKK